MATFKHRYTSKDYYDVIEVTDKETRKVDKDYPDYLKALIKKTVFEKESGDEFISIKDGEPVESADKETILTARKWVQIRSKRDALLRDCDWTQISDSPKHGVSEWINYRKALRDITIQSDPYTIVWPEEPTEVEL